MNKTKFIEELKELLEIEDSNFNTDSSLHLTSLSTLSIVAFVDENFDKQIKGSDLKAINTVSDLMNLIGKDCFE